MIVTLYAADWCGYCRKFRDFFVKNNIEYQEFDIEKSSEGKHQYDKVNKHDGVPVVVIKGYVIQGYSERQMCWAWQNLWLYSCLVKFIGLANAPQFGECENEMIYRYEAGIVAINSFMRVDR